LEGKIIEKPPKGGGRGSSRRELSAGSRRDGDREDAKSVGIGGEKARRRGLEHEVVL